MDRVPAHIVAVIEAFRARIAERYRVERMVLFGSYAWGTPHAFSDIDLLIVSPDFRSDRYLETIEFLSDVAVDVGGVSLRISPRPVSSARFDNAGPTSILDEIRREGRVIFESTSGV